MSDQDPDDEKPKGLALSSIATKKSEAETSDADDPLRDSINQLMQGGGGGAAQYAARLAKGHDLSAIESHILSQPSAPLSLALGAGSLSERISNLIGSSDANSSLIAASLAASQTTLDQFREFREDGYRTRLQENLMPPKIPVPENPLIETNKRLESIEKLFSQIADVAEKSAQTTLQIQVAAAEILNDFREAVSKSEKNATKNEKAAADGIKLAKWAIFITIFTSLAPIGINYFMPDPVAEALQQTVTGLQTEIDMLQAASDAQTQKLIEGIAASDKATAAAILEGIERLRVPAAETPPIDEKK